MGSRGLRGGLIATVIGFVGCVGLLLGRLRPHYLRVGDVSCHCFMLEVVLSLSFFLGGLGWRGSAHPITKIVSLGMLELSPGRGSKVEWYSKGFIECS